jgi:uncharacterized OB-fold protein
LNATAYERLKERYRTLLGTKCKRCGAESFPPARVCRRCGSTETIDQRMPREGKVISYTLLKVPSKEFREVGSSLLALVELKNGVRILAQLQGVEASEVHVGLTVKVEFTKLNEASSEDFYGYKFVKA